MSQSEPFARMSQAVVEGDADLAAALAREAMAAALLR
jgi:hypothetical protein